MTRANVDDPQHQLARVYRQRTEVRVVGEHHTAVGMRAPEDDDVRRADKPQLDDRHDVPPLGT